MSHGMNSGRRRFPRGRSWASTRWWLGGRWCWCRRNCHRLDVHHALHRERLGTTVSSLEWMQPTVDSNQDASAL